MLLIVRHRNEDICIQGGITIRVIDVKGGRVTLGIEAPEDVQVLRGELVTKS